MDTCPHGVPPFQTGINEVHGHWNCTVCFSDRKEGRACHVCSRAKDAPNMCVHPFHSQRDSPKADRIAFLERKLAATKADLLMKFEDADWHGVADAAMDLRDIESELKGLRF